VSVGNGGEGGGAPRTLERPRVGAGEMRPSLDFFPEAEATLFPGEIEDEGKVLGDCLKRGDDAFATTEQVRSCCTLVKVEGSLSFPEPEARPALLRLANAPTNAAYDDSDELPTSDVEARAVR